MTITVNQLQNVSREIQMPSFFKSASGATLLGFLDQNTVARVHLYDNYACIINGTPEEMKMHTSLMDMVEATEAEFMSAYSEAYEAMRLEPKMGVYTSDILKNGHED